MVGRARARRRQIARRESGPERLHAPAFRREPPCTVRRAEFHSLSFPNFVTVDFYDVGDVFRVVDVLNGVGG